MVNQAHASYPFLLAVLVGAFFSYGFSDFEIFIILLSAWLPDFDYIYALYQMKKHPEKYRSHHQFMTHAPLLYIPLVLLIIFFNWHIGFLFLYGLLTHFVMDSLIAPDGIRWLYPFSKKFFLWTSYTKGQFDVRQWLASYKKLPVYFFDNLAFVATVFLIVYFVFFK